MAPFTKKSPRLHRFEEFHANSGGAWGSESSGEENAEGRGGAGAGGAWLNPNAPPQVGHRVDVCIGPRWVVGRIVALQPTRARVRLRDTRLVEWIPFVMGDRQLIAPAGSRTAGGGRRINPNNLPADYDVLLILNRFKIESNRIESNRIESNISKSKKIESNRIEYFESNRTF